MKRQQVISRFFANKPSTTSASSQNGSLSREKSVPKLPSSPPAADILAWPPRGRRPPLEPESIPSSSKKRALPDGIAGRSASSDCGGQSQDLQAYLPKRRLIRKPELDVAAETDVIQDFPIDVESSPDYAARGDPVGDSDPGIFSTGASDYVPMPSTTNSRADNQLTKFVDTSPGMPNTPMTIIQDRKIKIPASDPVKHERFVEKLLARIDENGNVKKPWYGSPPTGKEKLTPLEVQVVELKAKYPDVVLMVEVGYRYRFFGTDAETASRYLGIFAHYDHSFLTASIPTFRLHFHVRRLVEAGLKVGVVRQTETAAIKAHGGNKTGPFSRGLSALYTRATLEAAEDLGGGETGGKAPRLSSYLMCIAERPILSGKKIVIKKGKGMQNEAPEVERDVRSENGSFDAEFGVVAVEPATGDVMFGNFKDSVVRTELEGRLLTCSPAELLLASPLSSTTEKLLRDFAGPASQVRVECVSRDCFEDGGALAEVLDFYVNNGDNAKRDHEEAKDDRIDKSIEVVMAMPDIVLQALALTLRYLRQFNLEKVLRVGAVFRPFSGQKEMNLSPNALRQLEILSNNTDGSENCSLLWLLNHTKTAFGARLLRYWVTHPLFDHALIAARLDAVAELARSMGSSEVTHIEGTFPGSGKGGGTFGVASQGRPSSAGRSFQQGLIGVVLSTLGRMPDLERGITRILHRTATAGEFVTVIQALLTSAKNLQRLQFCEQEADGMVEEDMDVDQSNNIRSPLLQRLVSSVSSATLCDHATRLLSALNTDAATAGDKLKLFNCKDGMFPEIEKCRQDIKAAEKELDGYLPSFRKLLRLPNLQYISINGLSHLVEAPAAQRVPANWMKVNSTKKSTRYHPPEVLESKDKLALAQEELVAASTRGWEMFLAEFASHYVEFRASVQAIAALDCLHSLAVVSRNQGYTRPEFVDESAPSQFRIESGRHPILDSTLQESFVPNDTYLDALKEQCQIITGPNMGGKSCYIRQVALIAIMAQVGSFVPAASARLHAFDSVQTRMGASDCLQKGSSTFFEELSETSTILRTATSRSLVILDELGRGTSTHDGVAIAYATLHHLLKETQCLTLFVTHYPKMTDLKDEFPGKVNPYYVSYMANEVAPLTEATDHKLLASAELVGNVSASSTELVVYTTKAKVAEEPSTSGQDLSTGTENITFLYKLVPGIANRSFGLHVARLAQIPEACVLHAASMAAEFEMEVSNRNNNLALGNSHGSLLRRNVEKKISTEILEGDAIQSENITATQSRQIVISPIQDRVETSLVVLRDSPCHLQIGYGKCIDESQIRQLLVGVREALNHDPQSCLSLLKDIQKEVRAAVPTE